MSLLVVALAVLAPANQGASSFLLPEGAPYTEAPTPEALILFRRGPHPICAKPAAKSPLADACTLYLHLTQAPLSRKRLQSLARRVVNSLSGAQQSLLRARLMAIKARRTVPCLQRSGVGLFAKAESRMILARQRDALQAYMLAMRGMDRMDARAILPEVAALVRQPYEYLAEQTPPEISADYAGTLDLLPTRLSASLRLLARSVGQKLPDQTTAPIQILTKRRPNAERERLWLEGEELMVRSPGSLEPLRLRGDEALEALESRLKSDHPDVLQAARLAGVLGFTKLRSKLTFISGLDDPAVSRAGWTGRLGLAAPDDHDALVKWLIKGKPQVDPSLETALRRFSDLAGDRIRKVLPSQWPVPILKALVRHSNRFDQRVWYTALLEHKDPRIKVLAHAAMRKTKPEDWLTARLNRIDRCSADHLRLLMPERKAVVRSRPTSSNSKLAPSGAKQVIEELPEDEEIDDSAGSVEIPEEPTSPSD